MTMPTPTSSNPITDPQARRKVYNACHTAIDLVRAERGENIIGTARRIHGDALRHVAFVLGVGFALDAARSVDNVRAHLVRRLIRSLNECLTSADAREARYQRLMRRIEERSPVLHETLDRLAAEKVEP